MVEGLVLLQLAYEAAMSGVWYVRRGEDQWGPLSEFEFDELVKRGGLRDDDLVWHAGWPDWRKFAESRLPPLPPQNDMVTVQTPDGLQHLPPRQALAVLVDEHLQLIGIPLDERTRFQYCALLDELLSDLGQPLHHHWTEDQLRHFIDEADNLISGFSHAVQRNDDESVPFAPFPERLRRIWWHHDLKAAFRDGYRSREACPLDRETLLSVVEEYHRQKLRSPIYEMLLVDAIVAREIYEYGETLKRNPTGFEQPSIWIGFWNGVSDLQIYEAAKGGIDGLTLGWWKRTAKRALFRLGLLYAFPILVAIVAFQMQQEGIGVLAGLFAAVAIGLAFVRVAWRRLLRIFREPRKGKLELAFELHSKMLQAYDELRGGTSVSPRRVREVLSKLAEEGAVWDAQVFSLLDAAIARSAGNWQ